MASRYNFDEIINRVGTGCYKWDKIPAGLIPLWVADMDFRTPDFITDAIQKRMECPVFGYPFIPKDYFPTISRWIKRLHGWDVDPRHICYVPGIVRGIGLAECSLLEKGAKVVILPPIYHPFRIVSQKNGMQVVNCPLLEISNDGVLEGYNIDFERLEECFKDGAGMLLLSNPQNPSGQCWSMETLQRISLLAAKYKVIVISDEIHAEMVLGGRTHIPYASVSDEAARGSITFMAPSKTFNIAGIISSYVIIQDDELREKFFGFLNANELDYPSIFSIETTLAAYRRGWKWRKEMLSYVEGNIDFVCNYINENIPGIKALRPQASFLVWLDCRGLGLSQKKLMLLMKQKAKLFFNDGSMFGPGGEGFVRMNVGCPRSVLVRALDQLSRSL